MNSNNTKVYITNIDIYNFRAFYGHNSVELGKNQDKNITYLVTGNAKGKTTLINAVQWCLWGTDYLSLIPDDDAKDIGQASIINWHADEDICKVSIKFHVDSEKTDYVVDRSITKSSINKYTENLNIKNLSKSSSEQELDKDSYLNIINKYFQNQYSIFDGEMLKTYYLELFKASSNSKALMKSMVTELLKYDLLSSVETQVDKLHERLQETVGENSNNSEINKGRTAVTTAKEKYNKLYHNLPKFKDTYEKAKKEATKAQAEIDGDPNSKLNIEKERDGIRTKVSGLQDEKRKLENERNNLLIDISPILLSKYTEDEIKNITKKQTKLKTNRNLDFLSNVIEEILNDGQYSVSNTDINLVFSNEESEKSSKEWLDSLNKDINLDKLEENIFKSKSWLTFFQPNNKHLNELIESYDEQNEAVKRIESEIFTENLKEKELKNQGGTEYEKGLVIDWNDKYQYELKTQTFYDDANDAVDAAKKAWVKKQGIFDKLNKAQGIKDDNNKRLELVNKLKMSVDKVYETLYQKMKKELFTNASKTLSIAMEGVPDSLYLDHNDTDGMKIYNSASKQPLRNPSEGTKQLATLAFLTEASKISSISSPFVIDYVYARLDLDKGERFANNITDYSHQLCIIRLDSEGNPVWFENENVTNSTYKSYTIDADEDKNVKYEKSTIREI